MEDFVNARKAYLRKLIGKLQCCEDYSVDTTQVYNVAVEELTELER